MLEASNNAGHGSDEVAYQLGRCDGKFNNKKKIPPYHHVALLQWRDILKVVESGPVSSQDRCVMDVPLLPCLQIPASTREDSLAKDLYPSNLLLLQLYS